MNDFQPASANRASQILAALKQRWKLILLPTLFCTLVAAYYAFSSKTWQASQSLVVRDDLVGDSFKPGQFVSLDSMKTAQETILHIAREPDVVRKALERLGPPNGKSEGWLDGTAGQEIVEDTRTAIAIVATNGAEFGRTEVIVLQLKSKSAERASNLVTALLDEIDIKLRKLRGDRLRSMQSELENALQLAEDDYHLFTEKLADLEREIGDDLPTLLTMTNDFQSTNDIQISLENIRGAKRRAQAELDLTSKHLDSLRMASNNPEAIVGTPNELLEAQPALKRLKDGLVDAQLQLSNDLGRFEEVHPAVDKSRRAIAETKRQIRAELAAAINGLQSQLEIREKALARLQDEEDYYKNRMANITKNRVRYLTLVSQSKKRNEVLSSTRARFAEIKSLQQAAEKVDLLTRLDKPFVSSKPLGPGKSTILGSGMIGGLLLGLGLVMFFSGPGSLPIIQPPSPANSPPAVSSAPLAPIPPPAASSQPEIRPAKTLDPSATYGSPAVSIKQPEPQSKPQSFDANPNGMVEHPSTPKDEASPVPETKLPTAQKTSQSESVRHSLQQELEQIALREKAATSEIRSGIGAGQEEAPLAQPINPIELLHQQAQEISKSTAQHAQVTYDNAVEQASSSIKDEGEQIQANLDSLVAKQTSDNEQGQTAQETTAVPAKDVDSGAVPASVTLTAQDIAKAIADAKSLPPVLPEKTELESVRPTKSKLQPPKKLSEPVEQPNEPLARDAQVDSEPKLRKSKLSEVMEKLEKDLSSAKSAESSAGKRDESQTIDLNTLREEISGSTLTLPGVPSLPEQNILRPSESGTQNSKNAAKDLVFSDDKKDELSLPEPNADPNDFESLHERIKRLTDSSNTARRSINRGEQP